MQRKTRTPRKQEGIRVALNGKIRLIDTHPNVESGCMRLGRITVHRIQNPTIRQLPLEITKNPANVDTMMVSPNPVR